MSQIDEEHPARVRTRRVSRTRSLASSTPLEAVSPVEPVSPAVPDNVPDPASSPNGSPAEVAAGPVPPLLRPGPGIRLLAAVVLAAVIGLVGGGAAAWAIYQHFGPAQHTITQLVTGPSGSQGETIGELAQSKEASVVTIATQPVTAATLAQGEAGFADGVVVSSDGLILTSAQAVLGASQLRVGLPDGHGFDAVIAGTDPAHGLVALRAAGATGLTPISLSTTDPAVGDSAVAVFSPPGTGLSVAVGTVSAVGQTVTTDSTTGSSVGGAFTIDATPQPQADGAPVLNSAGQLIGIVSTITQATPPPGITALSLAAARSLIAQVTGGTAQPAATFGTVSSYLDPAHAAAAGLTPGALIESVSPGGPAAGAGILAGDVVTQVNGIAISATQPFDPASLSLSPGDSAVVTLVRNGTHAHPHPDRGIGRMSAVG